jgi:hypothetical protein
VSFFNYCKVIVVYLICFYICLAKSGPHRLLSNDDKFKPFMKRAYEVKTKREDADGEQHKEAIMKELGIDEETFKKFQARTR